MSNVTQTGSVGRNDPCPCGSGRKFKKCCGTAPSPATEVPALDVAERLFQARNFGEAARRCEELLRQHPAHAGARHLLGLIVFRQGDPARAEALLRAAVAASPGDGYIHNSLSVVYQRLGRPDEAYRHCLDAIRLEPGLGSAHSNLGNLYKDAHRLTEAEQAYRKAVDLDPADPDILCNLGSILHLQNKWSEAIPFYRQALDLVPDYLPAHTNLGAAYQKLRDYTAALRHFERARVLSADSAASLNNVATVLQEMGEVAEARRHLELAIRRDPGYPGIYVNLGGLLSVEGKLIEAKTQYEKALSLDPGLEVAHIQMAALLFGQNEFQSAVRHYHLALQANPHSVAAYTGLGVLMAQRESWPEAERHYNEALRRHPGHLPARIGLVRVLRAMQRFDAARVELEAAILSAPDDPGPHLELAALFVFQGEHDRAAAIYRGARDRWPADASVLVAWAAGEERRHRLVDAERLLIRALDLPGQDSDDAHMLLARVYRRQRKYALAGGELEKIAVDESRPASFASGYYYELAAVLDGQGRYSEAFLVTARANTIKARARDVRFDRDVVHKVFTGVREFFTCERLARLPRAGLASDGPQPLFIVGFPRSGTTLLEQILVSHPNIAGGDELAIIGELCRDAGRILGADGDYPGCLRCLEDGDGRTLIARMRDYYLERARELGVTSGNAWRFTDKMPLNLMYLALIGLIFPRAPILHIVRNPLDAVVSAFFADFAYGNEFALNLGDAAFFYAETDALVEHYRQVMNLNLLQVRYEDLVTDQQATTRKLLDFIGEPWDDRCLAFHETDRVSRTASYAQVKERIYTSSLSRYRHYEQHLGEAIEILRPTMGRLGYL